MQLKNSVSLQYWPCFRCSNKRHVDSGYCTAQIQNISIITENSFGQPWCSVLPLPSAELSEILVWQLPGSVPPRGVILCLRRGGHLHGQGESVGIKLYFILTSPHSQFLNFSQILKSLSSCFFPCRLLDSANSVLLSQLLVLHPVSYILADISCLFSCLLLHSFHLSGFIGVPPPAPRPLVFAFLQLNSFTTLLMGFQEEAEINPCSIHQIFAF